MNRYVQTIVGALAVLGDNGTTDNGTTDDGTTDNGTTDNGTTGNGTFLSGFGKKNDVAVERHIGVDEATDLAVLKTLGFTDAHLGVASGYSDGWGADALAGGPLEGKEIAPMLITRNVDNPDDVIDYLEQAGR